MASNSNIPKNRHEPGPIPTTAEPTSLAVVPPGRPRSDTDPDRGLCNDVPLSRNPRSSGCPRRAETTPVEVQTRSDSSAVSGGPTDLLLDGLDDSTEGLTVFVPQFDDELLVGPPHGQLVARCLNPIGWLIGPVEFLTA